MEGIARALRGSPGSPAESVTSFVIGAPELAGAIRQVAPFAAEQDDEAALDCVLLDVTEGEVTAAATDRYRLAARTLALTDPEGPPRRIPVAAGSLNGIVDWLLRRRQVQLTARAETLIIGDHDQPRRSAERIELAIIHDRFPDYRRVLTKVADPATSCRMITDRIRLLELIAADQTGTVLLDPRQDQLRVRRLQDPESHVLPAYCSGEQHRLAFSPALLAFALQSSVGPDVLIEGAPERAVVVRSADQGSFSTLVMPQRFDSQDEPATAAN